MYYLSCIRFHFGLALLRKTRYTLILNAYKLLIFITKKLFLLEVFYPEQIDQIKTIDNNKKGFKIAIP